MDELIFYEVAAEKENEGAYLVTGNQRHFPMKDFIVTPAKMIKIIENEIQLKIKRRDKDYQYERFICGISEVQYLPEGKEMAGRAGD